MWGSNGSRQSGAAPSNGSCWTCRKTQLSQKLVALCAISWLLAAQRFATADTQQLRHLRGVDFIDEPEGLDHRGQRSLANVAGTAYAAGQTHTGAQRRMLSDSSASKEPAKHPTAARKKPKPKSKPKAKPKAKPKPTPKPKPHAKAKPTGKLVASTESSKVSPTRRKPTRKLTPKPTPKPIAKPAAKPTVPAAGTLSGGRTGPPGTAPSPTPVPLWVPDNNDDGGLQGRVLPNATGVVCDVINDPGSCVNFTALISPSPSPSPAPAPAPTIANAEISSDPLDGTQPTASALPSPSPSPVPSPSPSPSPTPSPTPAPAAASGQERIMPGGNGIVCDTVGANGQLSGCVNATSGLSVPDPSPPPKPPPPTVAPTPTPSSGQQRVLPSALGIVCDIVGPNGLQEGCVDMSTGKPAPPQYAPTPTPVPTPAPTAAPADIMADVNAFLPMG